MRESKHPALKQSFGRHARHISSNVLWTSTASTGPALEPFTGNSSTDVAIVGAGVAGLSTALHLAESGVSVTLLEAESPGSGATGRSGGLIAPDFIRPTPSELVQDLGTDRGERLIRLVGSSASMCFDLIRKHALVCEANQGGFWSPAHDEATAGRQQLRATDWAARGYRVRFAGIEETAEKLGSNRYRGAAVFEDGGSINPLAFSRELVATALRLGAAVHGHSRVLEVTRRDSAWVLKTERGELHAKRVVLAANGGNAHLHPRMRRTTMPLDVIEYASVPLSADQQAGVLKDRVSFTDKQPYVFTARYEAGHRLIAAFPDFPIRRSKATLKREAISRLEHHFPQLRGIDVEYLWPGRAWLNPDLLPRIYALDEGAFAIQACNGRGLAVNTALGAELAAALATNDFSRPSVQPQSPAPIPGYFIARHAPAFLMLQAYLRNRYLGSE